MFGFDVPGIHIVEEFGLATEWPNRDGRFDLTDFRKDTTLKVQGTPSRSNQHQGAASLRTPPASSNYSPLFSSVFSNLPHSTKRVKVSGYSLKVTLASLEKGKVKTPTRQIYVLITEDTANVPNITLKCKEELGIEEIKLVSANGLPFEDSNGTRGLSFWKSASRKVYAIDLTKEKADEIVVIKDEHEEHVTNAQSQDVNMQDIKEAVKIAVAEAIHQELPKCVEDKLNANFFIVRAVQNAIVKEILDCFECIICKETIQPPVVVSTCCDSVIGCKGCIQIWTTNNSGCPKCRNEVDFVAIELKGFDILTKLNNGFSRVG
ncbi:hypothetical protein ACROYT_G040054 [Oculina patagonica]